MFTGKTNHTTAQRHRETEKLPGEKTDSQATTAKMARKVKLLQGPKDNTHDTCTVTCCIQRIGKRPLNSGMPPCLMTVAAVATPSSCLNCKPTPTGPQACRPCRSPSASKRCGDANTHRNEKSSLQVPARNTALADSGTSSNPAAVCAAWLRLQYNNSTTTSISIGRAQVRNNRK